MKKAAETVVIGTREIIKNINSGAVSRVLVASNCPENIIKKFSGVPVEKFNGDQRQLGTSVGKPFPVAAVGYGK